MKHVIAYCIYIKSMQTIHSLRLFINYAKKINISAKVNIVDNDCNLENNLQLILY